MATALPIVATARTSSDAAIVGADPIFAAIAAHWTAYEALPATSSPDYIGKPSKATWRKIDAELEAFSALAETTPTTFEGVVALATHLRRFLDAEDMPVGAPCDRQGMAHAHALEASLRLILSVGRA